MNRVTYITALSPCAPIVGVAVLFLSLTLPTSATLRASAPKMALPAFLIPLTVNVQTNYDSVAVRELEAPRSDTEHTPKRHRTAAHLQGSAVELQRSDGTTDERRTQEEYLPP